MGVFLMVVIAAFFAIGEEAPTSEPSMTAALSL
jgi:hypothetical protein